MSSSAAVTDHQAQKPTPQGLSQEDAGKKKRLRTAFITGITGQDGSYLTELLLNKGYVVHGLIRRASTFNTARIEHLFKDHHEDGVRMFLHYGDLSDAGNLCTLIAKIKPDEIYNLAAQSHVRVSFDMPQYTANIDALGVLRLLDAVRTCGMQHSCRLYQASTSELYGLVQEVPQKETTPFYPRSPYAVAKQFAFWIVKNYREAYGMHLSNGILFNHESPRRGPTFVTRKITRAVARMHLGLQKVLYLGNLDACRDWGHSKDYVESMWLMLQEDEPDDYVIATGEMHTVREFVEKAFKYIGIQIEWHGPVGIKEIGVDAAHPERVIVRIDPRYFRPTEVEQLLGDSSKARSKLGWAPRIQFDELVGEMVASDLALVRATELV